MGPENRCWVNLDMAIKWTVSGVHQSSLEAKWRSINQISSMEKKEQKAVKEGEGVIM